MRKPAFLLVAVLAMTAPGSAQAPSRPAPGSWFVRVTLQIWDVSDGGWVYPAYDRWPYGDKAAAVAAAEAFAKEGICLPQANLLTPTDPVWCYPAARVMAAQARQAW